MKKESVKSKGEKPSGLQGHAGQTDNDSPGAAGASSASSAPDQDARQAAVQRAAYEAELLRRGTLAACMAAGMGATGEFSAAGYQIYLEQFVRDCGSPSDPEEITMLEQIAFAHLRVARLHMQAETAKSLDQVKLYNATASRLLGEHRRMALAVRAYRGQSPEASSERKPRVFRSAM